MPCTCIAQTCVWVGPSLGSWSTPENWYPATVPNGATFIAIIQTPSTATISSDVTLAQLRLPDPGARVYLSQSKALGIAGGAVSGDGLLRITGAVGSQNSRLVLLNDAEFSSTGGTGQVELVWPLTATAPKIDGAGRTLVNGAGFRIFGAGGVQVGTLSNEGVLESWVSGKSLALTAVSIANGGTIRSRNGCPLTVAAATLVNSGLVEAATADLELAGIKIQQTGQGRIDIGPGRIVRITGGSIAGGRITSAPDGLLDVYPGPGPTTWAGVDANAPTRVSGTLALDQDHIGPGWPVEVKGYLKLLRPCVLASQTLVMSSSGASVMGEPLTVGAGSRLVVQGSIHVDLVNEGEIESREGLADLDYNLTLRNHGTVRATSHGWFRSFGSIVQDQEAQMLADGGQIHLGDVTGGRIVSVGDGELSGSGRLSGGVRGSGSLWVSSGLWLSVDQDGFEFDGLIALRTHAVFGSGELVFWRPTRCSGARIVYEGPRWDGRSPPVVRCHAGVELAADCSLEGTGSVVGDLVNHGLLRAGFGGASPGVIDIYDGSVTQAPGSVTEVDLSGSGPGQCIRITGSEFRAGGLLRVLGGDPPLVEPGQELDIVSCDGVTGSFDGLDCRKLADGCPAFFISYPPGLVRLSARRCAADFDGSGTVDPDDCTAFIAAFVAGDLNADTDGSGFVDTDDFDAFVRASEAGC